MTKPVDVTDKSAMPSGRFSTLDLLELPDLERAVLLRIVRYGPVTAEQAAIDLGGDPAELRGAIDGLIAAGRLRRLADGRVDAVHGHIGGHTSLPVALWPALATDRPISRQEVATLRTAIPILQFARARMGEFADHGPAHALRVRSFAVQLSYLLDLTGSERHLLRIAALFHDVGNVVERERHHLISEATVTRLAAEGSLPFTTEEVAVIALLCRWHRREYDPERVDRVRGEAIRTGLLASVLRVADAMDIDYRRSDYDKHFKRVLTLFYPDTLPYWTSLEEIGGVRIRCGSEPRLQVVTDGPAPDNMQIAMLRRDLGTTPLPLSVSHFPLAGVRSAPRPHPTPSGNRTLIVFPFNAHSLVMAARSRQRLAAAGDEVELLCYPDMPAAPVWLWADGLAGIASGRFARIVLIGERPDPNVTAAMLATIRGWRAAGAAVSVLNRYEANWSRLPALLGLGVESTVGGDWAYVWGDEVDEADLVWGHIAAFGVRDPTLSLEQVTPDEIAVAHGLHHEVFEALIAAAGGTDWNALAEPILERIAADDRAFFRERAAAFLAGYANEDHPGRVDGNVVVFDRPPGRLPQAFPWVLEAAIERQGRMPVRGLRFNVPYAIAAWPDGDGVEILAITHWREEDALPIRLLYPDDIAPVPQGNEHALHVRTSNAFAPVLVGMMIDACHQA